MLYHGIVLYIYSCLCLVIVNVCVGACVLVHDQALQYGDSVKTREEKGHREYGVCETARGVLV